MICKFCFNVDNPVDAWLKGCHAEFGQYSCSRPEGHDGPHVACAGEGHHDIIRWGKDDFDAAIKASTPKRRAIQICAAARTNGADALFALCNDGTIWRCYDNNPWKQFGPIPQDGKEES